MLNYEAMDQILHALSDKTRRQMVERLAQGPASATDLSQPFEMTLSAVMQHLAVLQRCGLVRSEKIGRVRTYSLVTEPLREIEQWLHAQRTNWEATLDRLHDVLAKR